MDHHGMGPESNHHSASRGILTLETREFSGIHFTIFVSYREEPEGYCGRVIQM